jgi:hypothetical protein
MAAVAADLDGPLRRLPSGEYASPLSMRPERIR